MRWVRSYAGSREETLAAIGWASGDLPALPPAPPEPVPPPGTEWTLRPGASPPRGIILDPGHFEPVFITDYNYYPLLAALDDDVTIIEWDMALGREDRETWAKHIANAPGLVQVAPYRQYYGWCKPDGEQWGYVHRQHDRPVTADDPDCDYFGFGLTYIPLWVTRTLVAECNDPDIAGKRGSHLGVVLTAKYITDVTFSAWHRAATGHRVPIRRDVRPVHLHYEV